MNKSTGIVLALAGFFIGMAVGFIASPVKKGITIQYGELSRKYQLGMVLLCLGEVGRADALFEEIAASDTAYPLVKRARAYLSSHDSGTILSRRFL